LRIGTVRPSVCLSSSSFSFSSFNLFADLRNFANQSFDAVSDLLQVPLVQQP